MVCGHEHSSFAQKACRPQRVNYGRNADPSLGRLDKRAILQLQTTRIVVFDCALLFYRSDCNAGQRETPTVRIGAKTLFFARSRQRFDAMSARGVTNGISGLRMRGGRRADTLWD